MNSFSRQRLLLMMGGKKAAVPWYLQAGTTGLVAAWQAGGAQSYAASLKNLVNPGTHDLSDAGGIAPACSALTGWTGASGKYLLTDIVASANMSIFIKYSNYNLDVSGTYLAGGQSGGGGFVMSPLFLRMGATFSNTFGLSTGILGIAGSNVYQGDILLSNTLTTPTTTQAFGLLCQMYAGAVDGSSYPIGANIQAAIVYNTDMSAKASIIYAAMASHTPVETIKLRGDRFVYSSSIGV